LILVMSGTEEGREIVKELNNRGEKLLATVTTEYGFDIYDKMGLGHLCLQGGLDVSGLTQLIRNKKIKTLVDATHPYATQASLNAIKICKECGIKYIRFQRGKTTVGDQPFIHIVKSIDDAVEWCSKSDKERILLATGFKSVEKFTKLKDKKEIYVRILPMPAHIEQCIKIGIKSSNILALQGPFTLELNKAMFRQYKIDIVITKDSGNVGGVPEKIQAAEETGIDVVLIKRQEIEYPLQCASKEEVFSMLGVETV
jgi:precorrin-6A/cobalt-precorrin-6A reductase